MAYMTERFQCCFCGKNIPPISPDVGGLMYYTHAERPREAQSDQQFWCHTKCLTDRLHPSAKMYVLDVLRDGTIHVGTEGHSNGE
jgi:hypothetical protein